MLHDIRKILVPLNSGQDIEPTLDVGARLGRFFGAHLAAVLIGDDPHETAALAGEGLSGAMINDMIATAEHESQRRLLQTRLAFDRFLETHDIVYRPLDAPHRPPESGKVSASLELLAAPQQEAVTWLARLADFTLIPHLATGDSARSSETLHAVLFDSGRPVVIAPPSSPGELGRRICVAWNGTSESAVALRSVLPWARHAEAVRIITSPDYQRRGPEAEQAVDYLAMHGIEADIHRFTARDRPVGACILESCSDFGGDILAMGAYSHSRLRQMILGGVTRHVLEHAELTVLMTR